MTRQVLATTGSTKVDVGLTHVVRTIVVAACFAVLTSCSPADATPVQTALPVPSATRATRCGVWHEVANPRLNGSDFYGISTVSSTNAWVVGSRVKIYQNLNHTLPLAEHWDRRRWTVSGTTTPADGELRAVLAISGANVWAVGDVPGPSGVVSQLPPSRALIEHWNGRRWRTISSPLTGADAYLVSIAALSPTDVWAVGGTDQGSLVERWNGSRWRIVHTPLDRQGPNAGFGAIAYIGPRNIWTGGSDGPNLAIAVTEHWNGRRWLTVNVPTKAGGAGNTSYDDQSIYGLTVASPSDVLALSEFGSVLRWTGRRWVMVHSLPFGAGSVDALGIASRGSKDVWVVGERGSPHFHAAAEHWNGSRWTWKRSAAPRVRYGSVLRGIAVSPTQTWAVGFLPGNSYKNQGQGLIEELHRC
ncbi:MAG TPA: hypothetical protein VG815_07845 [Chloroflexota bacterium]|jgi:hypothetical protein|nr:hypothetical protein [Chloroflexota bacterium]